MNMRSPHRNVLKWDRQHAMELYDQGCTDLQIADATGAAKSSIATWRREKGLPPNTGVKKDKTGRKSQLAIDAEEARKAGMNYGAWKALQGS